MTANGSPTSVTNTYRFSRHSGSSNPTCRLRTEPWSTPMALRQQRRRSGSPVQQQSATPGHAGGRVILTTATGLYWIIQISRCQAVEPVAQAISLGSKYANQVRRTQRRSIPTNETQLAARADQENALIKGDTRGIYGQYPPRDDGGCGRRPPSVIELGSRPEDGETRLWRDHADRDEVLIQVDIRPIAPDVRWWLALRNLLQNNMFRFNLALWPEVESQRAPKISRRFQAAIATVDSVIDGPITCSSAPTRGTKWRHMTDRRSARLGGCGPRGDRLGQPRGAIGENPTGIVGWGAKPRLARRTVTTR